MKHRTDPERLLDDVLEESIPPGFRGELLEQTLRQVRRRKRARRVGQSLLITALLVGLPLALWKRTPPPAATIAVRPQPDGLVRSRPLPPSMIVETRSGSVYFVASSAITVIPVETRRGENLFREIDDDQLLALAGGRPVALVRQDSAHAEFLVLDSADQNGFPVP
jgi:hypothetical protein